jgi:ribosomal protein S2
MSRTNFDTLLEAGSHFGTPLKESGIFNAPYIFMETQWESFH